MPKHFSRLSKAFRFPADRSGNVAVVFGVAAPVLIALGGAVIDYSLARGQHSALQAAADAAAIAGARELAMAGVDRNRISQVATAAAIANFAGSGRDAPTVLATVTSDSSGVRVDLAAPVSAIFGEFVRVAPDEVKATATAKTLGEKICVIGLEENASQGIRLQDTATLSAGGCSIYANSTNPEAITAQDASRLEASTICSSGGYRGLDANYRPVPLTDCPQIDDPFATLPQPAAGGCIATGLQGQAVSTVLTPGTYCRGIEIKNGAKVTLMPGIYVMKDGPLRVESQAELRGEYVGFYFTGNNAVLRFTGDAVVELGAPKTGQMAGMLFWQDRTSTGLGQFRIDTNYANVLLGTIYLPQGRFTVDAEQSVAEESAYTALVVKRLELSAGPRLVLNTDYDETDVPVPVGVGPTGATRLVN